MPRKPKPKPATKPARPPRTGSKSSKGCSKDPKPSTISAAVAPVETGFSCPRHLRPETAQWWLAVVDGYSLEKHHVRLLTLAAESWDRCSQAREALAQHGLTYEDRFGQPHARPEVGIERDSRISFARLVREMSLDLDPPADSDRPPRVADKRPTATFDDDDRRILGIH